MKLTEEPRELGETYEMAEWDWQFLGAIAVGIGATILGLVVIVTLYFILTDSADAFIQSFE